MRKRMRETPVRQKRAGMNCGLFVLVATASLVASVGFAQAAVPECEPAGPRFSAAASTERNLQLASQLPRISTPQVHVNTAHVTTGNVHPAIGVNPSAVKIRDANSQSLKISNAHQFDKNNGGKGKGGSTKGATTNSGLFLKLDGIDGESTDGKGRGPDIQ